MKGILAFPLYFFVLFSCNTPTARKYTISLKNNNDTSEIGTPYAYNDSHKVLHRYLNDDTLYHIINRIPEVKNLIKKINSGILRQRVSIMINERPENTFKYYWLQVGIDNGSQFLPVYNFLVENRTRGVSYFDTSKDSVISLQEWRSNRGW